jgi:hypothetical protein
VPTLQHEADGGDWAEVDRYAVVPNDILETDLSGDDSDDDDMDANKQM